ncbi:MFS transporter [Gemella haemolysans]|uniref:MFS transporter n=1 Tax=Gemella haemolysans TaxID=1379 RepID=A0AAW6B6C3_9BACL|nr:MFS transporter [Gemella haemolysans]MDB6185907.1 MFS transporter [Gemella haemolysans]MDU4714150.1 MFS transporter [Gemella haemolysans]
MNIFLKNKLYRLFTISSAFGNAGRTLFDIAFIIYATNLPNPELAVSIVSIATTLPYIISFILGYFADQTKDKYNRILSTRFYQFLLFSLFAFVCIYGVQWWIFIVLVFVNVVADILGGYNGYLSMSINTRLVRKEQLSEALAFISSINNTISLGGKAVGVFVLGFLSYNYSYFGLLNAALFLIAFLILAKYKNAMKAEIGSFKINNKEKVSTKRFLKDTIENFKILREIKKIYNFVILFLGMNFYSSAMFALLLVILVKNETLLFGNVAYTITLLEIVEVVSTIIGGVYQISFYKNMSLKNNAILEIILFIMYVGNLLILQNKFILIILTVIIGYFAGISNPKLDALILQSVPEEKQTSIYSIFSTVITISVPIGTTVILFFANAISASFALYSLLLLLIIVLLYSFKVKQ